MDTTKMMPTVQKRAIQFYSWQQEDDVSLPLEGKLKESEMRTLQCNEQEGAGNDDARLLGLAESRERPTRVDIILTKPGDHDLASRGHSNPWGSSAYKMTSFLP